MSTFTQLVNDGVGLNLGLSDFKAYSLDLEHVLFTRS